MKHARFALLALPLLLAAGCAKPSQTPSLQDDADEIGAPSVSVHTFADKADVRGSGGCEFSLTFPELTRPSAWNMDERPSDPVLDRANREILRAYGLMSATGTVVLNPDEVAAEFIDMCRSDLEDITRELGPEAIANMNYADDSTFSIQLLTSSLASLTVETYQYTGGAHGNSGMRALTLDMATGQKLTLGDVIKNDQLQSVMKSAYADILKDYEDALYEEARTEINAIVNDTSTMTAEQQSEKFGSADHFFFTGDGMMLFWDVYEITPYVAGRQMVFFPWSKLEDKLLIKRP
ncbi:DUF3298 and DUF4163 domain-containing protein [Candidatus Uhrbacteria bacterium]|nr:DUF3298 and DUF4163 domain-containing protein [Candidatus Uhrbacteria bacterium]